MIKRGEKRFLAMLLAGSMMFSMMPESAVVALAAEKNWGESIQGEILFGETASTGLFAVEQDTRDGAGEEVALGNGISETVSVDEDEFPDSEELFEFYAAKTLGLYDDVAMFGADYQGEKLTGQDKIIYDYIKPLAKKVADGELDSAVFQIPLNLLLEKTEYTAEELGVDAILEMTEEGYAITAAAKNAMYAKLDYSSGLIGRTLLRDCPYDMYWAAKTTGWTTAKPGISANSQSIRFSGTNITFSFYVDPAFSVDGLSETFAVDTVKTGAAKTAAENAKTIVAAAEGKSDYEKLVYYRQQICDLVSYNTEAAESGSVALGTLSPWQLIYVFDNDPETNVVCEGYSKAFQYLSELTVFGSSEIYVYQMTGEMDGGAHMWNMVHMEDGKNYLTDVTNCDTDTIGATDKLFMQGSDGAINGTLDDVEMIVGYQITVPGQKTIAYTYDGNILTEYTEEERALADSDYVPPAKGTLTNVPVSVTGCAGAKLSVSMLSAYTGWQWDSSEEDTVIPSVLGNTIEARAVYTGADRGNYENTETMVTVTAGAHDFSYLGTEGQDESCHNCGVLNINYPAITVEGLVLDYNGSVQTPVLTLKDGNGSTILPSNYEVQATAEKNVSDAYTLTISGKNDYAGTRSATWSIRQAVPDIGEVFYDPAVNGELFDTTAASAVVLSRTKTEIAGELKITESKLSAEQSDYHWTFTPTDSGYKLVTGTVTLTVQENELEKLVLAGGSLGSTKYTYGDAPDFGDVVLKAVYKNGSTETIPHEMLTYEPLQAGDTALTVSYTVKGVTKSYTFENSISVEQAVPDYVLPTGLRGVCGRQLSTVLFSDSHFAWKTGTTQMSADPGSKDKAEVEYTAIYTPEDTKNYQTVEVKVPVAVEHVLRTEHIADTATHALCCSGCGCSFEPAPCHGGVANCTEGKKCEDCGYEYDKTPDPDNHDFGEPEGEGICIRCGVISLELNKDITFVPEDVAYDREEHTASVQVFYKDTLLTPGTDYEISQVRGTAVGAYDVVVTGLGKYIGTVTVKWNIFPEGLRCEKIPDQPYTGKAVVPTVNVYHGMTLLTKGKDYTITYKNNVNAGKASVIVKGIGNYSGSDTMDFRICPVSLETLELPEELLEAYTGKGIKPALTITYNGRVLKADTDYSIRTVDASGRTVEVQAVGRYNLIVSGKGNYEGTVTIPLTVTEAKVVGRLSVAKIAKQTYDQGKAITPAVVVKDGKTVLTPGTDYELSYKNNCEVGTATVSIHGIGRYAGTRTVSFEIVGTPISKAKVEGVKNLTYTGENQVQTDFRVTYNGTTLKAENYTVSYQNNLKAGTATMVITGRKGFCGTLKKTFKILPYEVKEGDGKLVYSVPASPYAKGGAKPEVSVSFRSGSKEQLLEAGRDYTVTYKNNTAVADTKAAKAPVAVVKFKGNFKGSAEVKFAITAQSLGNLNMVVADKQVSAKADGWKQTAVKIVDLDGKVLKAGVDYEKELVYSLTDGTVLGTGSTVPFEEKKGTEILVTAKGIGNYAGTELTGSYRIVNTLISGAKIVTQPQEYTGKAVTPKLKSIVIGREKTPLIEGVDYEITGYSNNVKKGTATMTIRGIGSYGGTKVVKFKIGARTFRWEE